MTPSTPAPTDPGALADWIDETRREAEKHGDKEQANLLWRTGNVISHGSHTTYPSRDIAQSVRDVVRDLAAALRNSAPQETRGDFQESVNRIHGAISGFGDMQPEEDETWESWYPAAFDLLSQKVRVETDKLLAASRSLPQETRGDEPVAEIDEATQAQHFNLPKGQPALFTRAGILKTCQCRDCRAKQETPSSPAPPAALPSAPAPAVVPQGPGGAGEASLPTYGQLPWEQLGRDVNEATMGQRVDFRFATGYPGHNMTLINFNSLARIVDKYRLAASQQSPRLEREALEAAERELTDLARPICCVYNRTAKKYEFTDAHIAQALPGTFEVIRQIRAALLSPDTTVASSTSQVSPGFTQCAHCWQPATCKKYGCSEPVSSNHPREVSK